MFQRTVRLYSAKNRKLTEFSLKIGVVCGRIGMNFETRFILAMSAGRRAVDVEEVE